MKKVVWILLMQFVVVGVMAQSLQDLENNPTFKGITIGMPVSELGSKVRYVTSDNGFNVYLITDSYYLSVFNVKMTKARVLARNGKVYGIEVVKEIKAPKDELIVFSTDEIDIIESGLKEKYGNPTHGLTEQGEVVRTGTQWNSATKQVSTFIDFYGTFQGYRLVFALCEREIDF